MVTRYSSQSLRDDRSRDLIKSFPGSPQLKQRRERLRTKLKSSSLELWKVFFKISCGLIKPFVDYVRKLPREQVV